MPRTNKHSSEFWLKLILRFNGYLSLPAFVAVIMPQSWLAWCVSYVEPETPVRLLVSYLARGLSGLVVFQGAMLLVFASDVRRYRPPIRVTMAIVLLILLSTGAIAAQYWGEIKGQWFARFMAADGVYALITAVCVLILQNRIAAEDQRLSKPNP
jgi:hypothetical protein